ncbi:unnamed protein product [Prorocentrum cordatum]|uniref:Uncharacterized protein n=1 Tax=Prorocentrum cordatum TaxID=2364126 RepID=A0ABN9XN77_9DINO|nr:unnamed protein product [Polarella glacialis]
MGDVAAVACCDMRGTRAKRRRAAGCRKPMPPAAKRGTLPPVLPMAVSLGGPGDQVVVAAARVNEQLRTAAPPPGYAGFVAGTRGVAGQTFGSTCLSAREAGAECTPRGRGTRLQSGGAARRHQSGHTGHGARPRACAGRAGEARRRLAEPPPTRHRRRGPAQAPSPRKRGVSPTAPHEMHPLEVVLSTRVPGDLAAPPLRERATRPESATATGWRMQSPSHRHMSFIAPGNIVYLIALLDQFISATGCWRMRSCSRRQLVSLFSTCARRIGTPWWCAESLRSQIVVPLLRYAPSVVAETNFDGAWGSNNVGSPFGALARYIGVFGTPQNTAAGGASAQPIAMTAPVLVSPQPQGAPEAISMTAPVLVSAPAGSQHTIRGVRAARVPVHERGAGAPADGPPDQAAAAPGEAPGGALVHLELPAGSRQRAAGGAAGRSGPRGDRDGWRARRGADGEVEWQAAGYNPPFTLPFLKRNEVCVNVEEPSEGCRQ